MLDGTQIFVDEPAEYEARGDYIVSRWKGHDFVWPIGVAKRTVASLNRALDQWHESQGANVVAIPRKRH